MGGTHRTGRAKVASLRYHGNILAGEHHRLALMRQRDQVSVPLDLASGSALLNLEP